MGLYLCYTRCSNCRKIEAALNEEKIDFEKRDLVAQPPTKEELRNWWEKSELELRRFFNTSGVVYRELKLKDKLPHLSDEEKLNLLASDGKLVKRPIWVDNERVLVGNDVKKLLAAN
ncbi:MAG: arsenate reductase family protein [Bradymonadales bacterium]|jgi:arsenate reductase